MATLQSDIHILDNLLALNLNISLWSSRKKMTPEDLGGAELPPEELASLGSKRVADPASLKVFSTLKSRAFAFMDRHGIRFMSGWAIPEDKAEIIVNELISIREEFVQAKTAFLAQTMTVPWKPGSPDTRSGHPSSEIPSYPRTMYASAWIFAGSSTRWLLWRSKWTAG